MTTRKNIPYFLGFIFSTALIFQACKKDTTADITTTTTDTTTANTTATTTTTTTTTTLTTTMTTTTTDNVVDNVVDNDDAIAISTVCGGCCLCSGCCVCSGCCGQVFAFFGTCELTNCLDPKINIIWVLRCTYI